MYLFIQKPRLLKNEFIKREQCPLNFRAGT